MEVLFSLIESIHPISPELKNHLLSTIKYRELPRKEFLLRAGEVSRELCFLTKGLLRCFYEKGPTEVSSWFMKEHDFVFAIKSFYTQQPSDEAILAVEDTAMYYISYDELEHTYRAFPEFNVIGRILTIQYHQLWADQLRTIRMNTAAERYQWLVDHHVELVRRVPQKYLASYLDITETTLSKIRGQKML